MSSRSEERERRRQERIDSLRPLFPRDSAFERGHHSFTPDGDPLRGVAASVEAQWRQSKVAAQRMKADLAEIADELERDLEDETIEHDSIEAVLGRLRDLIARN